MASFARRLFSIVLWVAILAFPHSPLISQHISDDEGTECRPRIRIVALGDSTTAEDDWSGVVGRVYPQLLGPSLESHGISADVINAGIGDTTTREAVVRLDTDVRRHDPGIVIVQFGINDSWIDVDQGRTKPRLTREEYRDNLLTIIGTLRSDGATVILMTPNPMRWSDFYTQMFTEHSGTLNTRDARGINRLLDLYAQDVRDLARDERVPLVDIMRKFEEYDESPGQSVNEWLIEGDLIHPNDEGHRVVCEMLTEEIVMLLDVGP